MKSVFSRILALALMVTMCFGIVSCGPKAKDDTIYVGNTAATTGAGASIGVPFNLGIQAAFAAYNAKGGFNGRNVALKHYDDGGDASQAVTLMEKLIHEDEVFAIVGNYGTYAVEANLSILKENGIPMVYAASGAGSLFNNNATSFGDRCIFPVQPLNQAEGQILILRAFAPAADANGNITGGFGATKVGVISNSDEASQSMVSGIKLEAETSGLTNIIYQNVNSDDYSAAAAALQAEGCDVIIITVVGSYFISALTALANVNYNKSVLTTYNNANAAVFNDENSKMTEVGENIFSKMAIFAQGWLDINDLSYYYKEDSSLYNAYRFLGMIQKDANGNELGVPGFTEKYWSAAIDIFNYAASLNDKKIVPLNMSYDSYALAGYIAGDLFCQALEEMEKQGMELTRENLVAVLESRPFTIAMADEISYQNGVRAGVQSFSLIAFFDSFNLPEGQGKTDYHAAASNTIFPLSSIEDYRALLKK